MEYRINKQKCIGCRVCLQTCPGATKMTEEGKAEIIDQGKLKQCGGESICPVGAIEKISEKEEKEETPSVSPPPSSPPYRPFPGPSPYGPPPPGGRGLGRGRGPGWSRGMGRKWREGRG